MSYKKHVQELKNLWFLAACASKMSETQNLYLMPKMFETVEMIYVNLMSVMENRTMILSTKVWLHRSIIQVAQSSLTLMFHKKQVREMTARTDGGTKKILFFMLDNI